MLYLCLNAILLPMDFTLFLNSPKTSGITGNNSSSLPCILNLKEYEKYCAPHMNLS